MTNLGYQTTIAIIGRPNVGKSTLLNTLLGTAEQVVTHKAHTTRTSHQVSLNLSEDVTVIIEDTPGLTGERSRPDQRGMRRVVNHALEDSLFLLLILDATDRRKADDYLLNQIKERGKPAIVALNKSDIVKEEVLFNYAKSIYDSYGISDIVPISALRGIQVPYLKDLLATKVKSLGVGLPEIEIQTQESKMHYLVMEHLRKQLLLQLREELPYQTSIVIDKLAKDADGVMEIAATLNVSKKNHVGIVLGKGGTKLNTIGYRTRKDISSVIGSPVRLFLEVKHRPETRQHS